MFLKTLQARNPALLQAAGAMALDGRIPPNTFVLDLDTIEANAAAIRAEAGRTGLRLYFMTKQFGRNPLVTKAIVEDGAPETVAVDIACADALAAHGIRLGHVGNLVQIPRADVARITAERPEAVTVFSVAKAAEFSRAAAAQGVVQGLLLRVADPGRDVYLPGMDGGITLDELPAAAEAIRALPSVRIDGVTTFPALSYTEAGEPSETPNFETLRRASDVLGKLGVEVRQVNAPGNTCAYTLAAQARFGATHVEPGHGVLGTTPFHLRHPGLAERPASCYVSEVAHHVGDRSYIYGGGFFVDDPIWLNPDFRRTALVGTSADELMEHEEDFLGAGSGSTGGFGGIDYYGYLDAGARQAPVGATVVMGFRIQSFVTRGNIAVVRDCAAGGTLLGIFDQRGERLPDRQ
jgi:predicted amino acid racemase